MTYNKRFSLKSGRFYDGENILTDEEVLNILNGLDEGINKVLKELYRKDIRKDINLYEENKELKSLCKVLITHIDEKSIAFVIDEDIRRLLE